MTKHRVNKTGSTAVVASHAIVKKNESPKKGLLGHVGVTSVVSGIARHSRQAVMGASVWLWGRANAQSPTLATSEDKTWSVGFPMGLIGAFATLMVGLLAVVVCVQLCRQRYVRTPVFNDRIREIADDELSLSLQDLEDVERRVPVELDTRSVASGASAQTVNYDIGAGTLTNSEGETRTVDGFIPQTVMGIDVPVVVVVEDTTDTAPLIIAEEDEELSTDSTYVSTHSMLARDVEVQAGDGVIDVGELDVELHRTGLVTRHRNLDGNVGTQTPSIIEPEDDYFSVVSDKARLVS